MAGEAIGVWSAERAERLSRVAVTLMTPPADGHIAGIPLGQIGQDITAALAELASRSMQIAHLTKVQADVLDVNAELGEEIAHDHHQEA